MPQFAEVVLPLAVQGTYTYRIPPTMQVGAGWRVLVPFGRKKYYTAIVVMTHDVEPQGYKVKEIERNSCGSRSGTSVATSTAQVLAMDSRLLSVHCG